MYTKLLICRLHSGHRVCRTGQSAAVQKSWCRYLCRSPCCTNCDNKSEQNVTRAARYNPVHIQMLSENLHRQIFKKLRPRVPSDRDLDRAVKHLRSFDLWDKKVKELPNVDFKLPELLGDNIDEHFRQLALDQIRPYIELVKSLLSCDIPEKPETWTFSQGWTRYNPDTGTPEPVPYPSEEVMVFDVEVLMAEGDFPTMATAVTSKAWYSWCSSRLVTNKQEQNKSSPELDDLIPLETDYGMNYDNVQWLPRLVIGHNVGFDRSFIKEQYFIQATEMRFLDTMSLHIAISGLTSLQRVLYMASKTGSRRKEVVEHEMDQALFGTNTSTDWMKQSSLNNLSDVYQLYCKGKPLDKSQRDVFVEGNMLDVRNQFQELMSYCAGDVTATLDIFKHVWPLFQQRFPHPVTLAGMLEMGTVYLPINSNWSRYIEQSDKVYSNLQQEITSVLQKLADDACSLLKTKSYKNNVWLWDLDWTVRPFKYKKNVKKQKSKNDAEPELVLADKQPYMAGYPNWYRELCPKQSELKKGAVRGPTKITTQRRVTPKLLSLVWDGYPLHYNDTHGWGYLVPNIYRMDDNDDDDVQSDIIIGDEDNDDRKTSKVSSSDFPFKSLLAIVADTRPKWLEKMFKYKPDSEKTDQVLDKLHQNTGEENMADLWPKYKIYDKSNNSHLDPMVSQPGVGPFHDILPGCDFYKLPHKDGEKKRVGNPLAKDFLSKIEEGVLRSYHGNNAEVVLKCNKMCSYWKNNMDRIRSQLAVYLDREHLPEAVLSDTEYREDNKYGAIVARVVTAGTVTRRAVESTWLTASNAYPDRIGSELKAMIQSPPGYKFVGADVDSQELWIASILGDAHFAGLHGCTAFGWMTLQGNKNEGTDLHSRTAQLVGITRDHAKIFNYGRIYGAGVRFAEQLLRQFNHQLTQQEARRKARVMYESTKGRKVKQLVSSDDEDEDYMINYWQGGSESSMFNKLEQIAMSKEPRTPVLGCKISKALEPQNVAGDFMTSRVNWVVQSSAVDYLHLMLVCMRWLLTAYKIEGRFSISIHDEVRYLVRSDDCYRAALALQITNLLTRAMFAYKLNMNDLPQSVAFFSAVDIDSCLRKEVTLDCVTPSNPEGLSKGYNIKQGEALTIYDVLEKTKGSLEKSNVNDVGSESSQTQHVCKQVS